MLTSLRTPDDTIAKIKARRGVWRSSFVLRVLCQLGGMAHWAVRFLRDDEARLLGIPLLTRNEPFQLRHRPHRPEIVVCRSHIGRQNKPRTVRNHGASYKGVKCFTSTIEEFTFKLWSVLRRQLGSRSRSATSAVSYC